MSDSAGRSGAGPMRGGIAAIRFGEAGINPGKGAR
jgi:hypothetical protein